MRNDCQNWKFKGELDRTAKLGKGNKAQETYLESLFDTSNSPNSIHMPIKNYTILTKQESDYFRRGGNQAKNYTKPYWAFISDRSHMNPNKEMSYI